MCQKTVETCKAKNNIQTCIENDDFDNLENVLKMNLQQKGESDSLLDKFNKLLEDNKNDCNNLNKIFLENKTKFSQDIEYIEILMDKVRAMMDEMVEKHKEKEELRHEESNRQLLQETIRDTIKTNFEEDILNTLSEAIRAQNGEEEEEEEEPEEEESDASVQAEEFIADVEDPEYYEEAHEEEAEDETIDSAEGESLVQSSMFTNAFNKVENLGSSLFGEMKTFITGGTSLFQLPSSDKNSINKIFVELSFKLNDTPERDQMQYLLSAHQKMKTILDNIYVSLKELYDSYQGSSTSCAKRLNDFTEKRNEVLAANLLNQLEIEKIASKINFINS
jgi:hypothetical protein